MKAKKASLSILKTQKLHRVDQIDNDIFGMKSSNRSFYENKVDFKGEIEKCIDSHLRRSSPFYYGLKNKSYVADHFKSKVGPVERSYVNRSMDERQTEEDKTTKNTKANYPRISSEFIEKRLNRIINLNKSADLASGSFEQAADKIEVIPEVVNEGTLQIPDKHTKIKMKQINEKIQKREKFTRAASARIIETSSEVNRKKNVLQESGTFYFHEENRPDFRAEKAKKRADYYLQIQRKFLAKKMSNTSTAEQANPNNLQANEENNENQAKAMVVNNNQYAKELDAQTQRKKEKNEIEELKERNQSLELHMKNTKVIELIEKEKTEKMKKIKDDYRSVNKEMQEMKAKEIEEKKSQEQKLGEDIVKKDQELKEKETVEKKAKETNTKKELYIALTKQVEDKKKNPRSNKSRSLVSCKMAPHGGKTYRPKNKAAAPQVSK